MSGFNIRRPNFSDEETSALIKAYGDRAHIINPAHKGDGASANSITNSMKCKAWREITDAVNSVGGKSRSVVEVTRKYKNYKSKTRAINAENIREMTKTGGGSPCLRTLSATQIKVLESIPKAALTGIEGGIDLEDIRSAIGDKSSTVPNLTLHSPLGTVNL